MNPSRALICIADNDRNNGPDRYLMRTSLQETDPSVTIVESGNRDERLTLLDTLSQGPEPFICPCTTLTGLDMLYTGTGLSNAPINW